MIKKPIEAVTKFHESFGLGIEHTPKADLLKNISELRFNLMKEENEEYNVFIHGVLYLILSRYKKSKS